MSFPSRFFRTPLLVRTITSAAGILVVLGSLAATSAQAPAAAPAPRVDVPAPIKTMPAESVPPSGASTQSAMQIVDMLATLSKFDSDGRTGGQKIGFQFPERAVNEYLAYSLRNRPRPGISGITVKLLPKNDIAATVDLDFGFVKQWNPELLPEAMRPLLTGMQKLQVNAHFESSNGTFKISLKDAQGPDGKELANKIMSDLMQAIGSRQPESYDASKPIPLPFGLKRVWTEKQSVYGET